ncbi:DUF2283 domain-containing protein [Gloeocapsa sp. PCC 73106]|uniref:DUF2283 domain-containing protein n=1 Tax=Gloeocapsa sp. PCC 73106 TaxID=102232 RepID=UPI0002ABAFF1|nr:DUF2283 domain-containing protein [Gloeocapsa sp. PCC 73106]ELR99602.1 uncharacterized conserved small protein [Gloeocapsa sp. PCC 73106]
MKIIYDPQVDVLSIRLSESPTESSTTLSVGLVFDYDKDGNVVKLSILNASKRVDRPETVEYSVNLARTEQNFSAPSLSLEQRLDFLKLPLEERRRQLAQQASDLVDHYQQNTDWKEFLAGDIIDY